MKKKIIQNKAPEKKKPHKKWVGLAGAGFQMGITIFGCAYMGSKLDEHYVTKTPWFTLCFVLFGVFASLYLLIKQIKNLDV